MKKKRNVRMSRGEKKNFYRTVLKPTTKYGAGTWCIWEKERFEIDDMEMKGLQSMCEVSTMEA